MKKTLSLTISLLAVFLVGCSKPVGRERYAKDFEEEIRRNSEILQKDSTNAAAQIALANAYLERVKTARHRSRGRDWEDEFGSLNDSSLQDLREAARAFESAIRVDSLNDVAWTGLARAYLALSDSWNEYADAYGKAHRFLRMALALNPISPEANYVAGLSYSGRHFSNKPHQAIYFLNKAISYKHDFADAYYALAEVYQHQQQFALARANYYHAITFGLADASAFLSIAGHFSHKSDYESPVKSYFNSLNDLPKTARAPFAIGVLLFAKPSEEAMVEMYKEAYELDTLSGLVNGYLGYWAWRNGHVQEAVEFYLRSGVSIGHHSRAFYENVISVHPEYARAYADLARVLPDSLGDQSIELLKKSVALDPGISEAVALLFEAYCEKGTPDSATKYLERYFERSGPDRFDIVSRLAWLYAWSGSLPGYIDLFKRTRGTMRDVVLWAPTHAYAYGKHKYHIDAKTVRSIYYKLIGSDTKANCLVYSFLGMRAGAEGDSITALSLMEKAYRSDPGNLDAGTSLASIYEHRGQYVDALRIRRALINSHPSDTESLYSAGSLLEKLGRKDEAAGYYRRVHDLDPEAATEAYEQTLHMAAGSDPAIRSYQRAARLGHKAAQDTLKRKNISW